MDVNSRDLVEMRIKYRLDSDALKALKKRFWTFNIHSDEAELVAILQELMAAKVSNGYWAAEMDDVAITYAIQLLALKQQQVLVQEQKESSSELVASTRRLAYATIALAMITGFIALEPLLSGK